MKIDLSIRQLLMLSGVLSMLLVLLIVGASLFNSMRLNEAVASANRTTEALRLQMDADMRHDAIIGGVYGALLAAERGERNSLPVKRKELGEDIDRLREDIEQLARLNLNPQVQAQLKAVEPALEEYARSALAIVDAAMQSADAISQVGQVDQAYSGLEAPMEQMSDLIQADANVAKTRAEAVQAQNRWQIIGLLALALVVMSLGALLISQRVSAPLARLSETARRIQETGDLTLRAPTTHENEIGQTVTAFNTLIAALQSIVSEVRGNSTRILQASGTLVGMAGETTDVSQRQSEAAAAMAAAMEELSVSIDQMSDHAQAAAESSQASGRLAKEGVKIVTDASREMREIAESVRASAQIINQLGERAARISSIVGVIKEVADQTNLLALNAAIEAARAGEQGRGFAVVADEVRKLAERTTQSTQEIAGMVADIQNGASSAVESMENGVSRVERGVRLADGAGQSMQQVAASATSVSASVADISNAIREQSVAGQEIAQRVEQVAQMSEESHGAAEKSAAHATHLSELARTLEAEVARFRA